MKPRWDGVVDIYLPVGGPLVEHALSGREVIAGSQQQGCLRYDWWTDFAAVYCTLSTIQQNPMFKKKMKIYVLS